MALDGRDYLVQRARAVGVRDARVLDALRHIAREDFVPEEYRARAYDDEPVPTLADQVTSQPSLIARMVESLELTGTENVLEVGTGYGFQTALLALLAREVTSIEREPSLAAAARQNLVQAGLSDVRVLVGDGTLGAPDHAPFDAVIVSAAFPSVPDPLREQLTAGGRLVQPVGPGGHEIVTVFRRRGDGLVQVERVAAARFVRLYGEHAFPG